MRSNIGIIINMTKKTIVTARSVMDNTHIFIKCNDPKSAFNTAHELHKLGEHRYIQIRLRSSKPSLKSYRWVSLLLNGA